MNKKERSEYYLERYDNDPEYYAIIARDFYFKKVNRENAPKFREYIAWIWEHKDDDLDYKKERIKKQGRDWLKRNKKDKE